jgi:hypothetical protein
MELIESTITVEGNGRSAIVQIAAGASKISGAYDNEREDLLLGRVY